MVHRADMRTAALLDLGFTTTSEYSVNALNRCNDQVTADISRLAPRERIYDYTHREQITDEEFTTHATVLATAVTLTNKPIKYGSEVVTNTAGTTTYTRDTDYTMDYANGIITPLAAGTLVVNTTYEIDYKREPLAVNLASLTTLLQVITVIVEGSSPQVVSSFYQEGDVLWLTTKDKSTQHGLADKQHVYIYYNAQHTAPTDSVDGTFARFFDDVCIKGMVAYALRQKAQESMLFANTREASAATAFAVMDEEVAKMHTALENVAVYLKNNSGDDAAAILTVAAYEAEIAAIKAALDKVATELASATRNADSYLNSGDDLINAVNTGGDVGEGYRRYAETKVAMARTYLDEGLARLQSAEAFRQRALAYMSIAEHFTNEAIQRGATARGYAEQGVSYLQAAQTRREQAARFEEQAKIRLVEYDELLKDRVQIARERSRSSRFQYPQSASVRHVTGDPRG